MIFFHKLFFLFNLSSLMNPFCQHLKWKYSCPFHLKTLSLDLNSSSFFLLRNFWIVSNSFSIQFSFCSLSPLLLTKLFSPNLPVTQILDTFDLLIRIWFSSKAFFSKGLLLLLRFPSYFSSGFQLRVYVLFLFFFILDNSLKEIW